VNIVFGISKRTIVKIKSFVIECRRVLKVTKKPSREEFKVVSKVSAIGAGIIGFLGFLVHLVYQLLS